MVTYCYITEDGRSEDRFFPMGTAPPSINFIDGSVAKRDYAAEHRPRKAGSGWPMTCYASGVNPNQAQELRDFYKKHSFRCDVKNSGDPVYENSSHRKAALKLRNLHDKHSFC